MSIMVLYAPISSRLLSWRVGLYSFCFILFEIMFIVLTFNHQLVPFKGSHSCDMRVSWKKVPPSFTHAIRNVIKESHCDLTSCFFKYNTGCLVSCWSDSLHLKCLIVVVHLSIGV